MKLMIIIALLLISGCGEQELNKYPITKFFCTNQTVWDERGNYPYFDCTMENSGNIRFRECVAKDVIFKEENTTIIEYHTSCVEKCFENCGRW